MHPAIKTMQSHRSYRDFDKNHSIPVQEIKQILNSARQAPSWMNGQHYSIININDEKLRTEIAALQPKNPHIASASVFFIFIADLYRMKLAAEAYTGDFSAVNDIDTIFTAATDAALAAQNAVVAAESLGYGICFIGGIRAIAKDLVPLLDLPPYTFPLFGLAIGKPAVEMALKPRLPEDAVVFNNRYQRDLGSLLAEYEQTMTDFGEARERLPWREKFARYYEKPFAAENTELLRQQGLLK